MDLKAFCWRKFKHCSVLPTLCLFAPNRQSSKTVSHLTVFITSVSAWDHSRLPRVSVSNGAESKLHFLFDAARDINPSLRPR